MVFDVSLASSTKTAANPLRILLASDRKKLRNHVRLEMPINMAKNESLSNAFARIIFNSITNAKTMVQSYPS